MCESFGERGGHLARRLVALAADEHHGHAAVGALDGHDVAVDDLELLERLPICYRVDEYERVRFLYVQSLHSRELVAARRVRYL